MIITILLCIVGLISFTYLIQQPPVIDFFQTDAGGVIASVFAIVVMVFITVFLFKKDKY